MLTPLQKEKNNSRRRDNGNHDNGNGYSHNQTPSYGGNAPSAQPMPGGVPAAAAPPAGGAAADPYAVYGGYQNYLAMWYASIAQQQQGGQGAQGPPGA